MRALIGASVCVCLDLSRLASLVGPSQFHESLQCLWGWLMNKTAMALSAKIHCPLRDMNISNNLTSSSVVPRGKLASGV